MRVLVVDDDPVSLDLVSGVVERLGHEVVRAVDGADAREKFLSDWFPVVIMDWLMPRLSGIELCRLIRSADLPIYTYIIFLTSKREWQDLIHALDAGADDFISKPLRPGEMQARLRAAERILSLENDLRDVNKELTLMNQRLLKMSRLDPLMEIGNRLDFEEKIGAFHQRALSSETTYGVVMCDVDHFKQHNDKLGHRNGDEILRRIAATIRGALRANDAAFRYGGEEVLLLLSQQDVYGAVVAAERVRQRVEQQEFLAPDTGEPVPITISCGVACFPLLHRPRGDWQDAVELADQALYEAKSAGRNCVRAACPDSSGRISFKAQETLKRNAASRLEPRPDATPVQTDS